MRNITTKGHLFRLTDFSNSLICLGNTDCFVQNEKLKNLDDETLKIVCDCVLEAYRHGIEHAQKVREQEAQEEQEEKTKSIKSMLKSILCELLKDDE